MRVTEYERNGLCQDNTACGIRFAAGNSTLLQHNPVKSNPCLRPELLIVHFHLAYQFRTCLEKVCGLYL